MTDHDFEDSRPPEVEECDMPPLPPPAPYVLPPLKGTMTISGILECLDKDGHVVAVIDFKTEKQVEIPQEQTEQKGDPNE